MLCLAALAVLVLFPSVNAISGNFYVFPTRLDFSPQVRTGAITVTNMIDEPLNIQVEADKWTEDAKGNDVYSVTRDVIFFPLVAAIKGKQQRIVRAGIQMPPPAVEKTYRLFIGEIPRPTKKTGPTQVTVAIRFGVPIFVTPLEEKPSGALGSLGIYNGVLEIPVKNTGNVHFILKTISVKGKDQKGNVKFSKDISGWYLLAGASRLYTVPITNGACPDLARIEVTAATDRPEVKMAGSMDVKKEMCGP